MSENYTLINWQNGEITQPAVVEIDGVDYQVQPAIETGNTPINADNLNHMDNGIRNATLKLNDKIETATVQLIAVTDTAPSECAENDKYYNTNTNLIYTATGTDTWGVTGETPSQLYLYMDISDEKLYYYDGNTFSSYGGGSGGAGGETLPIGSIMLYSGNVLPVNWLLCNGQAVSRTKYSALFEKIGTTYGSGDGSTTFNVPNLKGKVAVGKDDNDTDFDTLGETGGEKTHTLSVSEMPAHSHDLVYVKSNSTPLNNAGVSGFNSTNTGVGTKENAVENTGGGQAHNNLQPYIVQNFIIKAEQAPGTATLAEALPVGSQINFDGEVSDIPVGWQQVPDNQIVLYNDTTGTGVTGLNSITLSDSISNYSRIKLVIDTSRDGSSKYAYNIIKEFNINSTLTQFSESVCYDKIVWFTFSISNKTLSITRNRITEVSNGGITMTEGNYVYITKVIGYKE